MEMTYEHNGIQFTAVNMDAMRRAQDDWSANNPEPVAPKVPLTPTHRKFGVKLARQAVALKNSMRISIEEANRRVCEGIEVDDEDDEEYQKAHRIWQNGRTTASIYYILNHHIIYDVGGGMTLTQIRDMDDEALWYEYARCEVFKRVAEMEDGDVGKLVNYIIANSTLTWEHLREAGEKMGVKRGGRPILEVPTSGGGESQPVEAIGMMAAAEVGLPPYEYKRLTVTQRAEIAASYLTRKLLDYWAMEDARRNAKNK